MIKKVLYLTATRPDYSLNAVLIKGLRENGVEVKEFYISKKGINGLREAYSLYRQYAQTIDALLIGYNSQLLAIGLRPFCRHKIIYNAVLSEYERMIISRAVAGRLSLKALYYWLLDFLAVHWVDLTIVESDQQRMFFKKLFRASSRKVFDNYIGVSEEKFYYNPTLPKFDTFTVLFRGQFMPEAGVEYVIKATKRLESEKIRFLIIGGGIGLEKIKRLIGKLKPTNLELITDFLPDDKLREIMQRCHLSLGQVSNHERLDRTIPQKAYESLALKLPYLTAANFGILELLTPNETCLVCPPADAKALADKILWSKNNYQIAVAIGENGYRLFQTKLRTKRLARNLIDRINTLL